VGAQKGRSTNCWNSWAKPVGEGRRKIHDLITPRGDGELIMSEVIDPMLTRKATKEN